MRFIILFIIEDEEINTYSYETKRGNRKLLKRLEVVVLHIELE